jgi:archaellum component FlaF (FlaF/FlaG flagellin family)
MDVSRVNNWWMRYYVRLQKAERMIIEALATALEFEDVGSIKPKARRLMVQDVQLTSGEVDTAADAVEQLGDGSSANVRKAAKKLKASLKANLLPGESITLTTSKGSATVSVQESEIEA